MLKWATSRDMPNPEFLPVLTALHWVTEIPYASSYMVGWRLARLVFAERDKSLYLLYSEDIAG